MEAQRRVASGARIMNAGRDRVKASVTARRLLFLSPAAVIRQGHDHPGINRSDRSAEPLAKGRDRDRDQNQHDRILDRSDSGLETAPPGECSKETPSQLHRFAPEFEKITPIQRF